MTTTARPPASPCCAAPILASLADGVLVGSCERCHAHVARVHPTTRREEWLDGRSPWDPASGRPLDAPRDEVPAACQHSLQDHEIRAGALRCRECDEAAAIVREARAERRAAARALATLLGVAALAAIAAGALARLL